MLAPRPDDPASELTFAQALRHLDATALRPGQTLINRTRVMDIVRNWDPLKATSSVARSGTCRVVVEGHHTTIASVMIGRSGMWMGAHTGENIMVANCSWLPSRRHGRTPMTIVDEPAAPRLRCPRASRATL